MGIDIYLFKIESLRSPIGTYFWGKKSSENLKIMYIRHSVDKDNGPVPGRHVYQKLRNLCNMDGVEWSRAIFWSGKKPH